MPPIAYLQNMPAQDSLLGLYSLPSLSYIIRLTPTIASLISSREKLPPHILHTYSGVIPPISIEQERISCSTNSFNFKLISCILSLHAKRWTPNHIPLFSSPHRSDTLIQPRPPHLAGVQRENHGVFDGIRGVLPKGDRLTLQVRGIPEIASVTPLAEIARLQNKA